MSDGLGILLPYQLEWLDLDLKRVPLAVWDKSRRIGASWSDAASSVLHASSKQGGPVYYQSYSQDMTEEYINDAAYWAKRLHSAAVEIQAESVLSDDGRQVLKFRIDLDSGHSIVALPSSPRVLRSRGRPGTKYVLDEAAFVDDLGAVLKAAIAMVMWGGMVRLLSTQNGVENPWNDLITDVRSGKRSATLTQTTLDDAIEAGLVRKICEVTGREWSPEFEKRWRADVIESYGDDADEELFCVPARSAGAYFSRAQVEACMTDGPVIRFRAPAAWDETPEPIRRAEMETWIGEELDPLLDPLVPEQLHVFGFDFARRIALSVLAPIALSNGRLECPFVVEMQGVPHAQQLQVLQHVAERLPRFCGAAMDATGAGSAVAEAMADAWGPMIEQVVITVPWWREWMPRYRARMDDGEISFPRSPELLSDHRAVKLVNGVPRLPDGQTARGGRHGDGVVALALGCQAAQVAYGPVSVARTGVRASAGDWRDGFVGPDMGIGAVPGMGGFV
ncbi:MAG: hypothetical protein F4X59_17595 [Holophagales bacterium]|nr:hypothetical protein [Holophagales bacterium]MYC11921.1 hypothetical protein [Holophagales bacterium]MYI20489.1 hypothetical protein [Acidimicrobiia bacterium]